MSGNLNEDEVNKVFKEINDTQAKTEAIDINIIIRYIFRYKWLIIAMTLAAVTVAYAFTSLIRPVYQSSTSFEMIQYNDSDVVGGGLAGRQKNFYSSQVSLLGSKRVAERVVENLELYRNPEFTGELKQRTVASIIRSGVRRFLTLVGLKNQVVKEDAVVNRAPDNLSRHVVVGLLQSRVSVNFDWQSRLTSVTVKSFNPEVSADVANEFVSVYREIDKEDKEAEKDRRNNTLDEALADIQGRIGDQERRLAQFIRDNNVVDLDDANNLESQKLNLLQSQYIAAQSERISLESRYKFGSVEEINTEQSPQSDNAESNTESPALRAESDNSLTGLRRNRLSLLTEIRNLADIYKEDHPLLQEKQNALKELEKNIELVLDERKKALYRQYQAAVDKEKTLLRELEAQKELILTIQENSLEYNVLKRELNGLKQLHAGMLERVKRSGVASELQLTQLSIVEAARPNYAPVSPDMKRNVAVAGALGLVFALGIAGLMGYYDRRLRTPDALATVSPYRNLSVVVNLTNKEKVKQKSPVELVCLADPASAFAESFRSLRTSLMYSLPGGLPKALMVTSASPGEAKTTTIVNLAFTLQRNEGKRILIIDLDLRKPRLHKIFGVPVGPGVTDFVTGTVEEPNIYDVHELESVQKYMQEGSISLAKSQKHKSGLFVMSAGSLTSSPVELLEADKFKQLFEMLKEQFDVILIDSAPVMGLSDALILSSFSDAVILAVSADQATRESMRDTVKKLESVNSRVVGTVLTKYEAQSEGYKYTGKYDAYYYDYGKS